MQVVLETERLVLRRFTEADAEALFAIESDPDMLRYVGRKPLADAEAYRQKIRSVFMPFYNRSDGYGVWAVIEKESGAFIGGCSLRPALDSPSATEMGFGLGEAEMGYGLRTISWGRGYASEIVAALVNRAFNDLGAAQVVASVTVANVASVRVLEKGGLRPAGPHVYLPGENEPSLKYALAKDQFLDDRPGRHERR